MNLLTRLTIKQRFLASVCFFALPLGVLFYFNLDQLAEKIQFARQEIAGNRFQRPAIRLIKALGDYRAASAARRSTEISADKEKIEDLIHQLEAVNKDLGAGLQFSGKALKEAGLENLEVAGIASRFRSWQEASEQGSQKNASDGYEQLISDLRGLIGHAGDTSNLTLDPEMDSYYLADVTSVTAAQTLDRIRSAAGTIEPLLGHGKLAPADRTSMAVTAAMLKESDFDRITGDLDTAFKENLKSPRGQSATLRANVEPALNQYKADVQNLIQLLSSCVEGKSVGSDEFHKVAARANESSLALWEKSVSELDVVLQMRIDGFVKYRLRLLLFTGISLALAIVVLFLAVRGVTDPLASAVAYAERVAQGDVSAEIAGGHLTRGDEIGNLARAMQQMSARLRDMLRDISGEVQVLSAAAEDLRNSSAQMTSESNNASEKAHSVSAAAEQMSSNVTSVAAGMEQTTTNLANISTSTEQMTSTIDEIAGNSEKARRITHGALDQAKHITGQIHQLSEAAREIGKVTETINDISSQTNLLALNATIEAARAGAAGKGFAVVASEIKALAQQTAQATEDIRNRIAAVQTSTASGVTEIEKVSQVIFDVSEIVGSIAAAIEEQAVATKDIARNIAEASIGMREANERVSQSSQASKEIAQDIGRVDHAATEIADGSKHVRSSAEDLARISGSLTLTMGKFKI